MRGFASDNCAGVHAEVLAAIARANEGHATPYGGDPVSARARALFREHLGDVEVLFAFNGTGANVAGLAAMLRPWEAVICTTVAHITVDECGAPERFLGGKLIEVPAPDGKLTPELVRDARRGVGDVHHVQPRVVAITQSTELGTVYTPAEVRALADAAHELGMWLHMDGARIGNAAAGLGVGLGEASVSGGVDVLSFGGTKNGALGGEAIVVARPDLVGPARFAHKQAMQLPSKSRFVAAQFVALLENDLWRRNATHANAMARRLAAGVAGVAGVTVLREPQANGVFVRLDPAVIAVLREAWTFYVWNEAAHEVRWMCSWDTTADDVDAFVHAVHEAAKGGRLSRAGAMPYNGTSPPET